MAVRPFVHTPTPTGAYGPTSRRLMLCQGRAGFGHNGIRAKTVSPGSPHRMTGGLRRPRGRPRRGRTGARCGLWPAEDMRVIALFLLGPDDGAGVMSTTSWWTRCTATTGPLTSLGKIRAADPMTEAGVFTMPVHHPYRITPHLLAEAHRRDPGLQLGFSGRMSASTSSHWSERITSPLLFLPPSSRGPADPSRHRGAQPPIRPHERWPHTRPVRHSRGRSSWATDSDC